MYRLEDVLRAWQGRDGMYHRGALLSTKSNVDEVQKSGND